MTVEIILAIIATIAGIVAGFYKYRETKTQEETKLQSVKLDSTTAIVTTLISRIDKLENKQDTLNDQLYTINKQAAEDRVHLIAAHEEKIEQVRKEMRKLIEESNTELTAWRDKYFALMQEYHQLKAEHIHLETKFIVVEEEVKKLRALFLKRRKGDSVTHTDDTVE